MNRIENLPEGRAKERLQGLMECWFEEHPNPMQQEIYDEEDRLILAFWVDEIKENAVTQKIQAAIDKEEIGKGPSNTYQSGLVDGLKMALDMVREGKKG